MVKAVIYSRVSTGQQDTANQSVVLTDWAEQRGYEVVKVYQEEESAWRNGHQKQLAALLADARLRRFQAVLVWSLDRLSRGRSAGNIESCPEAVCLRGEGAFIPGKLDRSAG